MELASLHYEADDDPTFTLTARCPTCDELVTLATVTDENVR